MSKKITELPEQTTTPAPTSELAMVEDGETRKVTVEKLLEAAPRAGTELGQAPVWNGSGFSLIGIESYELSDADETVDSSQGSRFVLAVALTGNIEITLDPSSYEEGEIVYIERQSADAFTVAIVNGGPGGGTLYTMPASKRRSVAVRFDGTNFAELTITRLTAVA